MAVKIKVGKILIVVALTVLIWVWADMSEVDTFKIPRATISVALSTSPDIWVRLDGAASVLIEDVDIRGSASRIADIKRKLEDGSLSMEFFYDATQKNTKEPKYSLNVVDFLKKSDRISPFGLTVESCKPETIDVEIVKLVEKLLEIRCKDKDNNPVKVKMIEPPRVDVFVPEDWQMDKLVAEVVLSRSEIESAGTVAIEKVPFVELSDGQSRQAAQLVKIVTLPGQEGLKEYTIASATVGIVLSPNLMGKYDVELLNQSELSMVTILATSEAKNRYQDQPCQMLLYILDEDAQKTTDQEKKVDYNFPDEFIKDEKIKQKGQHLEAKFRITPLAVSEEPSNKDE